VTAAQPGQDATTTVTISVELMQSMADTVRRSLRVLRIPAPMSHSVWAEKHFYLSKESSYVEGDWICWPFQRAMMDAMGMDGLRMFTSRKSARIGYTKMFLSCLAYMAQHKRRNQVVYQPTDDDRDEFVTTELDPMLRDTKAMREVMSSYTKRDKGNTLRQKKFTTGLLHLRGGKAAKNYRRLTADCVYYDEFSGFDRDVEKEGSPGKLGDKRLEGSVFPKSIAGSTPKTKHNDNTEDREAEADCHLRWMVPCPHCGEYHQITWGGKDTPHGMKWTGDNAATVLHICPHCGGGMSQSQYLTVWHAGVWVEVLPNGQLGRWLDSARTPKNMLPEFRTAASFEPNLCTLTRPVETIAPKPSHAAMPIWTACAPQATWQTIVEEFQAAKRLAERGDLSLLKTWVNTTLGETWEEKGEAADEHELEQRAKQDPQPYTLGTVPIGALVLTTGVDVQGNRWEIYVWGWAQGLESWLIDRHIIEGNPGDERDWDAVDAYLRRRYTQAWNGGSLASSHISIDSGYHTQAVYNYVRRAQSAGLPIAAIKGSSEENRPILGPASAVDVTWRGTTFKKGIKVWSVGTDTAKDLLHGQLQITAPGAGYVHHPQALPREYYEQLTAEQRITVTTPNGTKQRWIKRRPRNEALDGRNYATHGAYKLGLHRWTEARWQQQTQAVQPPHDLLSAIMLPPAADTPATAATMAAQAQAHHSQIAPPPAAPPPTQPSLQHLQTPARKPTATVPRRWG